MLLGPKDYRRGQRDDNARLQKLERQYEQLAARIAKLEQPPVDMQKFAADPAEFKRGPGRPRKVA